MKSKGRGQSEQLQTKADKACWHGSTSKSKTDKTEANRGRHRESEMEKNRATTFTRLDHLCPRSTVMRRLNLARREDRPRLSDSDGTRAGSPVSGKHYM